VFYIYCLRLSKLDFLARDLLRYQAGNLQVSCPQSPLLYEKLIANSLSVHGFGLNIY